ncbi:MAG: hypothetical protein KF729_28495 [Sandaracinaceae bacterium]|nr:hypothetical protein [Sandaracinaceae bacterium]
MARRAREVRRSAVVDRSLEAVEARLREVEALRALCASRASVVERAGSRQRAQALAASTARAAQHAGRDPAATVAGITRRGEPRSRREWMAAVPVRAVS